MDEKKILEEFSHPQERIGKAPLSLGIVNSG